MRKSVLFVLSFFDYLHKKKIRKFLKEKNFLNFQIVFDIGAHQGESIVFFLKHFNIEKIFSFEASPINFNELKKNSQKLKDKFKNSKIFIENIALGSKVEVKNFFQLEETSSSTFNTINLKSKYLKKKNRLLNLFKKNFDQKKISVDIYTLKKYIEDHDIKKIDFIKIDTEGFEYEILCGLDNKITDVKLIMFEHHFDDMIIKNYKFRSINKFLVSNKFKQIFKSKMPFRKSFEYIYINTQFDFNAKI